MKLETYWIVEMLNDIFFDMKIPDENISMFQRHLFDDKYETYVSFVSKKQQAATHFVIGPAGTILSASGNLPPYKDLEEIQNTNPYLLKTRVGHRMKLDIKNYQSRLESKD